MPAELQQSFHVREGLYFERHKDASITVRNPSGSLTLTDDEWVSVVAHMSGLGGTSKTIEEVHWLHHHGPESLPDLFGFTPAQSEALNGLRDALYQVVVALRVDRQVGQILQHPDRGEQAMNETKQTHADPQQEAVETQRCSYCCGQYPKPVELHHDEGECEALRLAVKAAFVPPVSLDRVDDMQSALTVAAPLIRKQERQLVRESLVRALCDTPKLMKLVESENHIVFQQRARAFVDIALDTLEDDDA